MGGLLSQPVTTKESSADENSCFLYGASAMQGWRPEMEDAHTHKLSLAGKEEAGLFGVFDGHGGQEVALFCAKHLLAELEKMEAYQQGDFKQALHDVFLRLDAMVADKERWPELRELAGNKAEENPMTMDENDLPDYLNRALSAARQRQREMIGDEDEDEMEDEVGDPNFDPELQDSEYLDSSEVEQSEESDSDVRTPTFLRRHPLPGGPARCFHGGAEGGSGSEAEVDTEDIHRPGSRQLDSRAADLVTEGLHGIGVASPASGFSDGEYDYDYEDDDYENYSSDEFDSFEESGELSNSGKRLNSPCYRRPKSKDGKRPRGSRQGSRPGSSDSRPRSAPASRPTTVGSEEGALPWSPHSKSAFGLFSSSRLRPTDAPESNRDGAGEGPAAAGSAGGEVAPVPAGPSSPGRGERPRTPDVQAAAAVDTSERPAAQRPRSALLPPTPGSAARRRPQSAATPSTPGSARGRRSRPKTGIPTRAEAEGDDGPCLAKGGGGKGEAEDGEAGQPAPGGAPESGSPEAAGRAVLVVEGKGEVGGAVKLDYRSAVKAEAAPSSKPSGDSSTAGSGGLGGEEEDVKAEAAEKAEEGAEGGGSDPATASPSATSGGEDDSPQEHETLDPEAPTAGCTAVVAMVAGRRLLVANAGDSRCVCSREGVAHAMTEDHKPGNPEELARVLKAGGMVAQGRIMGSLNLSRAIGDLEFKTAKGLGPEAQMVTPVPEIREMELVEGDEFLVLACDGIWDVLSNQEVVTFVRNGLLAGNDPQAVCEQLCDRCCAKDTDTPERGCDNLSCMVVLFKELWHA